MSVTYLIMQYRVQYIIAPVDSMGTEQTKVVGWFKHEKGQSRIYIKFSL